MAAERALYAKEDRRLRNGAGDGVDMPFTAVLLLLLTVGLCVLYSASIGEGSIVGSASVVVKPLEPYSVAVFAKLVFLDILCMGFVNQIKDLNSSTKKQPPGKTRRLNFIKV